MRMVVFLWNAQYGIPANEQVISFKWKRRGEPRPYRVFEENLPVETLAVSTIVIQRCRNRKGFDLPLLSHVIWTFHLFHAMLRVESSNMLTTRRRHMKRLQLSRQVLTLAIVIAATASQSAQAGTIKEIGVDGSYSVTTFDTPGLSSFDEITDIRFPTRVRLGWFSTETLSIEISAAYVSTNQGANTLTVFGATIGIAIHFTPVTKGGAMYFQPIIGLDRVSLSIGSTSDSDTQLGIGAALGFKSFKLNGVGMRGDIFLIRRLETQKSLATTTAGLQLGFSFFDD